MQGHIVDINKNEKTMTVKELYKKILRVIEINPFSCEAKYSDITYKGIENDLQKYGEGTDDLIAEVKRKLISEYRCGHRLVAKVNMNQVTKGQSYIIEKVKGSKIAIKNNSGALIFYSPIHFINTSL